MTSLYLIPNFLADTPVDKVFPSYNLEVIRNLKYFIVENEKNARRFLKKVYPGVNQQSLHFFILEKEKHRPHADYSSFLVPALEGHDMGLITDAGLPAVADPGNKIVMLAHRNKIRVEPLVGPSSVMLALMASGLNGQHFCFQGYLPVKQPALQSAIKKLERESAGKRCTQIFIETPYRTDRMLQLLVNTLHRDTRLSVSVDLTAPTQEIYTMTVGEWQKNLKSFGKRPAVFLFMA